MNLNLGIPHHSLLAADPSGEAPLQANRDACRELTVRRSRRMALSTVNASRVTAGPAKLALDLERVVIMRAVTGGTWVHQQHQSLASQILSPPSSTPQQVLSGIPRGDR